MDRRLLTFIGIGLMLGLILATIVRGPLIGLTVGLGLALLVYFVQGAGDRGISVGRSRTHHYDALLRKAGGDKAMAERLINYEYTRDPDISREQAADRALSRWQRGR